MKRIYISGKITGLDPKEYEQNFDAAELVLRKNYPDCEVVNPVRIAKHLPPTFTHEDYMEVDFAVLKKCDAICMLKGWESSKGAKAELEYALRNDFAVLAMY